MGYGTAPRQESCAIASSGGFPAPPRQPPQQTMKQHRRRLRDHGATPPDWHVADEHIYRDDGYSGAKRNRPGLDRLRDRAALAAFECVLITAPDRKSAV